MLTVHDDAGWHKNQAIPLPDNLHLLLLPSCPPELSLVEHFSDELREKLFHNCVFDSIDATKCHVEQERAAFEEDSQRAKFTTHRLWIVNALANAN